MWWCVRAERKGRDRDERIAHLSTETVQSAALSLEGVDNVEGCNSLTLGVLSVGNSVADDALKEGL